MNTFIVLLYVENTSNINEAPWTKLVDE